MHPSADEVNGLWGEPNTGLVLDGKCWCALAARLACADAAVARAGRSPSRRVTWRVPSPSATTSGAPDRLLCPDPVRYLSVTAGPVERVASSRCEMAIGSNMWPIPASVDLLAGQDDLSEHNTDERRWPDGE